MESAKHLNSPTVYMQYSSKDNFGMGRAKRLGGARLGDLFLAPFEMGILRESFLVNGIESIPKYGKGYLGEG